MRTVTADGLVATLSGVAVSRDVVTVEHMSDPTEFLRFVGRSDIAEVFDQLHAPAVPGSGNDGVVPDVGAGSWWVPIDADGTVLGLDVHAAETAVGDVTQAAATRAAARRDLYAGALLRHVTP